MLKEPSVPQRVRCVGGLATGPWPSLQGKMEGWQASGEGNSLGWSLERIATGDKGQGCLILVTRQGRASSILGGAG